MSQPKSLVARVIHDKEPWLVSKCLPKDIYVMKEQRHTTSKFVPQIVTKTISAGEAREKGCSVNENLDDDVEVVVEITENIEEKVYWSDFQLRNRGKFVLRDDGKKMFVPVTSNRRDKIREELASAIEAPLSYVGYPELVELIRKEVDNLKQNSQPDSVMCPKILLLMGLNPQAEGNSAYARAVYQIARYTSGYLLLTDSQGDQYELKMDEEVRNQCRMRQLVLVLPGNIHFYDSDTDELVI